MQPAYCCYVAYSWIIWVNSVNIRHFWPVRSEVCKDLQQPLWSFIAFFVSSKFSEMQRKSVCPNESGKEVLSGTIKERHEMIWSLSSYSLDRTKFVSLNVSINNSHMWPYRNCYRKYNLWRTMKTLRDSLQQNFLLFWLEVSKRFGRINLSSISQ